MEFGGGGPGRPAQVAALRPPTRPPLHLERQRHGGGRRSLARYRGASQHSGRLAEVRNDVAPRSYAILKYSLCPDDFYCVKSSALFAQRLQTFSSGSSGISRSGVWL